MKDSRDCTNRMQGTLNNKSHPLAASPLQPSSRAACKLANRLAHRESAEMFHLAREDLLDDFYRACRGGHGEKLIEQWTQRLNEQARSQASAQPGRVAYPPPWR